MQRTHKEHIINNYKQSLESSNYIFLMKNCGLTVQNSKDIRNEFRSSGVKFTVIKNSLAKIAAKDSKHKDLEKYLCGPTAVAYCDEPINTAKIITKLKNKKIPVEILAASMNGNILESKEAASLSKMLSQEEVYAKILGLLKSSPMKLVNLFNEPSSRLVRVLKTNADNNKKQEK